MMGYILNQYYHGCLQIGIVGFSQSEKYLKNFSRYIANILEILKEKYRKYGIMHYEYAPIQIINIQFITVGYIVEKLCNKEERGNWHNLSKKKIFYFFIRIF